MIQFTLLIVYLKCNDDIERKKIEGNSMLKVVQFWVFRELRRETKKELQCFFVYVEAFHSFPLWGKKSGGKKGELSGGSGRGI